MKVEVNFKMKHILKRNVDSLHHLHLNHHSHLHHHHRHRHSRRRQHSRQYQNHHHQQQQQSSDSNNLQSNPLHRNVDQLLTVKRALFVDSNLFDHHHRQTSELLRDEMNKIEEEQCARYNFDFKNELPLEGNYQWTKMNSTMESSKSPASSSSSSSSPSTTTTYTSSTTTSSSSITTTSSSSITTTIESKTIPSSPTTSSTSPPPVEVSNWNQILPDESKFERENCRERVTVVVEESNERDK